MINIIIADDQIILSESLKQLIETDPELKVIACAENGKVALNLCDKLIPDVILMDIKMPECDGIESTKLIKEKYSAVKILMLTSFEEVDYIAQALDFGADGYLLKDVKPDMLKNAIKSVYLGMPVIHKNTLAVLTKSVNSSNKAKDLCELRDGKTIRFTPRELEIMNMVARGKTNNDIAKEVCLSKGRIANIITNIFEKTGLKDRTELAVFAIKNDIVQL